jgi:hypothetical protein
MDFDEFAKGLTEEQVKGLEGCKSTEDVISFCKENKLAVPDELMDGIAGGAWFPCSEDSFSNEKYWTDGHLDFGKWLDRKRKPGQPHAN